MISTTTAPSWSWTAGPSTPLLANPRPQPTTVGPSGFEFNSKDNYEWYLKTGALKNIMKLTGDSIAFWKDLYNHPNRDAWVAGPQCPRSPI